MSSERNGFKNEMKLDESSGFKDERYYFQIYKKKEMMNDNS